MRSEKVIMVDPKLVHCSAWNTRQPQESDPEVISLAASLDGTGQITPAVGRPHPEKPGEYELSAGARRRVACLVAGRELELIVREMTDGELKDQILVDNFQREDPDPVGEAMLIKDRLLSGLTIEKIAATYGVTEQRIRRRMGLIELSPEWGKLEEKPPWSVGALELLAALPKAKQEEVIEEQAHSWGDFDFSQVVGADSMQRALRSYFGDFPADAAFLEDPATFRPGCGPGCAMSSECDLFEGQTGGEGAKCLDRDCYEERKQLWRANLIAKIIDGKEKVIFFFTKWRHFVPIKVGAITVKPVIHWTFSENWKIVRRKSLKNETDRWGVNLSDSESPKLVVLEAIEKPAGSAGSVDSGTKEAMSREEKLQAKRWKLVHAELLEALKEAKCPFENLEIFFQFLVVFGSSQGVRWARNAAAEKQAWEVASRNTYPEVDQEYVEGFGEGTYTWREAAWLHLKPMLCHRLTFEKLDDLKNGSVVRQEMNLLAELISFDLKAAKLQADDDLRPPKSWGPVDLNTLKPLPVPTKAAKKKGGKKS